MQDKKKEKKNPATLVLQSWGLSFQWEQPAQQPSEAGQQTSDKNEHASSSGRIEHITVIAITKTRRNHHLLILLFRVHTVHFQNSLTPQSHHVISWYLRFSCHHCSHFQEKKHPKGVESRGGEFSSWGSIRASFLLYIPWLQAKKYSFVKQLPNIYLEHTKTSTIKLNELRAAVLYVFFPANGVWKKNKIKSIVLSRNRRTNLPFMHKTSKMPSVFV